MLVFKFCNRKELFSATGVIRTPSQGAALGLAAKTAEVTRIEATGQWGPCADVRWSPRQGAALAVAVKVHDMVEVHRVLAHPNERITQKTAQAMGIVTTGQWGPYEARLQVKAKRQAVQWIDGPDNTVSNSVSDEDLGEKPGEDESVGRRGALQREVQALGLEQQPALQERKKEIQEAPLDFEEGAQEALPDPAEATRKPPLDCMENTREAPSDSKEKTDPDEKIREVPSNTEKGTQKALPDPENKTRRHHWIPGSRHVTTGSQGKDTRGAIISRGGGTRGAIGSQQGDTGDTIGSREDTEGAAQSRGETREAPSDPRVETKYVAGLAEGSTDLKGSVVPMRRKLTISGNLPSKIVKANVKSTGERKRERSSAE